MEAMNKSDRRFSTSSIDSWGNGNWVEVGNDTTHAGLPTGFDSDSEIYFPGSEQSPILTSSPVATPNVLARRKALECGTGSKQNNKSGGNDFPESMLLDYPDPISDDKSKPAEAQPRGRCALDKKAAVGVSVALILSTCLLYKYSKKFRDICDSAGAKIQNAWIAIKESTIAKPLVVGMAVSLPLIATTYYFYNWSNYKTKQANITS
jgi:hypothetical protein